MTDQTTYAKGVMGEIAACDYLCQRGMELLERRFHSPFGEIDLVLLDGSVLVFAEVKARERVGKQAALLAITPAKQRKLIETARHYLAQHPEHAKRIMRFDVVAVAQDGIEHVANAFQGSEW